MKRYTNLICAVLSPQDLSGAVRGRQFFELLGRHPLMIPKKIGNSEPLRNAYEGPTKAISNWTDPVLWGNTETQIEGSVWFGHGSRHSCIYLRLNPWNCDQGVLKGFLLDACALFRADYGYIHPMTQDEMETSDSQRDCNYAIDVGVTTNDLKKGVPNLCWANVFGACYSELVKSIGTIGPLAIAEHDPQTEQTYLQLSPNIKDVLQDYVAFDALRQKAKVMIGHQFFWSMDNSAAGWTPSFQFEKCDSQ